MLKRFLKRKPNPYSGEKIEERWSDISLRCEFLPTDTVLDMGCGEGIVALELAPLVAHVHGVELKQRWVERATDEAKRRGITNAIFEQGSAIDYIPGEYDVVLFCGVLGKIDSGLQVLERLLGVAQRQFVLRYGVDGPGKRPLAVIEALFSKHRFTCVCFPKDHPKRGNLIVGQRN